MRPGHYKLDTLTSHIGVPHKHIHSTRVSLEKAFIVRECCKSLLIWQTRSPTSTAVLHLLPTRSWRSRILRKICARGRPAIGLRWNDSTMLAVDLTSVQTYTHYWRLTINHPYQVCLTRLGTSHLRDCLPKSHYYFQGLNLPR